MAAGSSINLIFGASTAQLEQGLRRVSSAVSSTAGGMGSLTKSLGAVGLAFAGIQGAQALVGSFIDVTKAYDSMKASLSATVGAADADAVFASLQQFAKETPFSLEEVTSAYQRMVNLGLNPSRDAMLAYGNLAASIDGKSIKDVTEAVADAVTGENERLKEFGITAKKAGDSTIYMFQGVPTKVKNTKEEIEKYLISVSKSVAGGKALTNQAETLGGRMSALSDSFKQLQSNLMESSGAASFLGEAVEKVTDFVSYLNDLVQSGAGAEYFNAILLKCQPLLDVVKDLYNWFLNLFPDDFGKSALDVLSDLWDDMMSFINLMRNFFGEGGFGAMMTIAGNYLLLLPNYVNEAVDKALEYLRYFQSQAINILKGVAAAISSGSISAGMDAYEKASKESKERLDNNLKSIENGYKTTGDAIRANIDKAGDVLTNLTVKSVKESNEQKKAAEEAVAAGEEKLKQYKIMNALEGNKNKDLFGDVGKKVVAKQTENAKNNPDVDSGKKSKKGSGGSSAAKSANDDYKKLLDMQQKMEEDRFKNGEMSAKTYYDKLLNLKLQQLNSEQNANTKAYQDNLAIINDTSSTEKEKEKALNANKDLQGKMNSMTAEEQALRQDIAMQLRDANKEYLKNINDIQKELNNISLGGSTVEDVMNDFADKYSAMRKRIKAEDEQNGTNDIVKLDQLEAITKAMAKVADNQREITRAEAEYNAQVAETNLAVADGTLSNSEAQKKIIELTKQLNDEKVKLLDTEVKLAQAQPGYNKEALAGIRQQLAETKKAQIEANDKFKSMTDGFAGSLSTAFDAVVDQSKNMKDILNDFVKDLFSSLTKSLTKGWEDSFSSFFTTMFSNSSTASSSTSGGWMSAIGSAVSSLWGGGKASGGSLRANKFHLVGENGPEYIYSGARPSSIMNTAQTQKMMAGSGNGAIINNFNITTKDANSFRYSKNQIELQQQREITRQVNRSK